MSIQNRVLEYLATFRDSDTSDLDDLEMLPGIPLLSSFKVLTSSSSSDDYNPSSSSTDTCSSKSVSSRYSTFSDSEDELEQSLPPLTRIAYPDALQQKIDAMVEQIKEGMDILSYFQSRKDFKNPSMLNALIKKQEINETGTNFKADVLNSRKWGPESFYDRLAADQNRYMSQLNKNKSTGTGACTSTCKSIAAKKEKTSAKRV